MTVNLLKRLESSVEAFRLTRRRRSKAPSTRRSAASTTRARRDRRTWTSTSPTWTSTSMTRTTPTSKRCRSARRSRSTWTTSTSSPGSATCGTTARPSASCSRRWSKVTPDHDVKLQRLKQLIEDKAANPINPGNRKVLIFSAFADTANYLYRELAPSLQQGGPGELRIITGGAHAAKTTLGTGYDFQQVLTLFSPRSKQRHLTMPKETGELDVLIGTDCISEGQNLQDCDYLVNYDIHWNPVRIIQRFGRIDRIGSTNAQIQLVNFWPNISLDEYINLKERVENRMVIADLAATGDDNVLDPASAATPPTARNSCASSRTRSSSSRTSAPASPSPTSASTTSAWTCSATSRSTATSPPLPKGLHAVVPADPAKGLSPGVIFALRNVGRRREHQPRQPPPPALPRLPRRRRQRHRRPHRGQASARPDPRRLPPVRRAGRRGHPRLQRRHQRRRRDGQVLRTAHRGDPLDDRRHRRTRPRQPLHRRRHDRPHPDHRRARRLRADRLPRHRRPRRRASA